MATRPPELYGIPISELRRLCRISLKTAQRWKAGQTVPPETALMILRGDLGCFDPAWSGWRIRSDKLYSPEGWEAPMGEVRALPLMRAQIQAYQEENFRLRGLMEDLEEQPTPDAWAVHFK